MHRTVVINVVGLTRPLLGPHTPNLNALAKQSAAIQAVTPAVTCSAQATYLTGKLPREHGIVANGWYFRDLNEVWLWRQSNRLVQSPRIWDLGRARDPAFTCANTFWWYAMATGADYTLTPRPLYLADGRKLPDVYTNPPELREELTDRFGLFPLFQFWGPATTIKSSRWIADAAMHVEEKHAPTLQLVYLPHLDYCLQRVGPEGDIAKDLKEIDDVVGDLLAFFGNRGCRVVVLSEYGILPVNRPVHPNRVLREAGLLSIKRDLGLEYLDTGACRAFAVADHQIAHVYIADPKDIPAVRRLFEQTPGVAEVLDADGKRRYGLDHERSGELVLLSEADSWFTYYYWLDDAVAPDFARTVDIHRKPGYDPCELFLDPQIRLPKLKIAVTLAKKILGFRYLMNVIPLDASLVKGSHGRATQTPHGTPILMSSKPDLLPSANIAATDVCGLILDHVFK
jgi:predicted AlkP superfamily pyrophosphatase or phosphodiesterase